MKRKYYEAYDDRYRQIHALDLQWSYDNPSPIVMETVGEFGIDRENKLLELGCGEGRDASVLMKAGYSLLATDISPAVIEYDRKKWPEFADKFAVLDCIAGKMEEKFHFIYAVAVVHMLVEDEDRDRFYSFLREHLTEDGIALVCTMGDGQLERKTDPEKAFTLQTRTHQQSGKTVEIAGTTCRMVSFETFRKELDRNGLTILKEGLTAAMPDFSELMYAVVRKENGAERL